MIYVLGVLGTLRICYLLCEENIFLPVREYFGLAHSRTGSVFLGTGNRLKDFIGRALSCFACTSVWVSFFQVLLLIIVPEMFFYFNLALSFSMLAIYVSRLK